MISSKKMIEKTVHMLDSSAWCLGFLAEKNFWIFNIFCQNLGVITGKVGKNLQDFSRSWKEI